MRSNNVKYLWAIFSSLLSIAGTFLLVFSLQVTSTNFTIVTTQDGNSALCVGKEAMFVVKQGGGIGIGARCPEWETGKPAAVINTEHPNFVTIALFLLIAGFVMQLISIFKPIQKIETQIDGDSLCPCKSGRKYKNCCGKVKKK